MTASQYRAIRHTSTFVVLKLGSALCDIAQQVKDDAKAAKKQLDIETKRGKKGGKVLAGLEAQVKDFSMKEVIMDEYMDDVFNGWVTAYLRRPIVHYKLTVVLSSQIFQRVCSSIP